jgi:AsmA protein
VINLNALQVKNLHITNVILPVTAAAGKLEINAMRAQLYQGEVLGNIAVDAHSNAISFKQNLSNISINPLLKDFMNKDIAEGRGNISINLQTHGNLASQFKQNLNGTVSTKLTDGAIKGINLAKSLRDFKAKFLSRTDQQQAANSNDKTDFSAFSASINFTDGIGKSDDLDMKSPFLRVGGNGMVNLRDNTLDYVAKVMVVNSSTGQNGADLSELKDIAIPVRIHGPFDQLSYQLQFAQISSEALKSALKAKAAPVIEEKKKQVTDQLKNKLKGLFDR